MKIVNYPICRLFSFTVQDHQAVLLFRNGCFQEVLPSGRHRFWRRGYEVKILDTREQQIILANQEILTADQVSLKASALLTYRVVDALAVYRTSAEPFATLYSDLQLALRETVSAETAEAFLQSKSTHGDRLASLLASRAERMGIALIRAEVRDVMLPAALKRSFMSALQERQDAQASLEKARADTATLRTLANAAKLIRDNPELLQLRYLETLKHLGASNNTSFVMSLADHMKLAVTP